MNLLVSSKINWKQNIIYGDFWSASSLLEWDKWKGGYNILCNSRTFLSSAVIYLKETLSLSFLFYKVVVYVFLLTQYHLIIFYCNPLVKDLAKCAKDFTKAPKNLFKMISDCVYLCLLCFCSCQHIKLEFAQYWLQLSSFLSSFYPRHYPYIDIWCEGELSMKCMGK